MQFSLGFKALVGENSKGGRVVYKKVAVSIRHSNVPSKNKSKVSLDGLRVEKQREINRLTTNTGPIKMPTLTDPHPGYEA